MTEQERLDEIAQLQAILASGMTSMNSDGESAAFDTAQIRQRLSELMSMRPRKRYLARRVKTIDLRNAF